MCPLGSSRQTAYFSGKTVSVNLIIRFFLLEKVGRARQLLFSGCWALASTESHDKSGTYEKAGRSRQLLFTSSCRGTGEHGLLVFIIMTVQYLLTFDQFSNIQVAEADHQPGYAEAQRDRRIACVRRALCE